MIKTAIFLGGGASAAEGAPVQSQLFKKFFTALRAEKNYSDVEQVSELRAYFKQIFSIDVLYDDLEHVDFPTFEEAIGLLDLAVRKRQSFKDFDLESLARSSNRIGFIRQYLVMLLAEVLEDKTATVKGLHRMLVERLEGPGYLNDIMFISTNYDLLIDRALAASHQVAIDYGVDFSNSKSLALQQGMHKSVVNLYKVHGSLNWLFCSTCDMLSLITCRQGILTLLSNSSQALCESCQSVKMPVIVPPTFFKDMSNIFLHIVWHKAEQSLQQADHLVFCGYSFPDADIHIKYLLKRIQTNRGRGLRITVINNYQGKQTDKILEEKQRYLRFLGTNINITNGTFEDFCTRPENFI